MAMPTPAIKPAKPRVLSKNVEILSPKILDKNVSNATNVVPNKAGIGIPRLLTSENTLGASLVKLKENSILVEAYIPEFAAEITEVKITAFITAAAEANPARLKTKVNGLIAISVASDPNKLGLV